MLFEKEIREAEEKLFKKGYCVGTMPEPNNDQYEVYARTAKVYLLASLFNCQI